MVFEEITVNVFFKINLLLRSID